MGGYCLGAGGRGFLGAIGWLAIDVIAHNGCSSGAIRGQGQIFVSLGDIISGESTLLYYLVPAKEILKTSPPCSGVMRYIHMFTSYGILTITRLPHGDESSLHAPQP